MASTMMVGAALATFAAAPAVAQEATALDEIVVTGSRIIRSDVNSAQPITITTGEDLRETGVISLAEALRRDPAIQGDGGFGQSSVLSGGGASSIDLRGFGPGRSLILVNGKRFSTFTDSLQNEAYDLGMLPTGMLERVEILRDGAGPTYGADAVAGVVNFILRENFSGAEVGGFYGISEEGDAVQYRANAVMGASFDRGSAVLGIEFSQRDELPQKERDFALNVITGFLGDGTPVYGSGFAPGAQLRDAGTNALVQCYGNDGGRIPAGTACPRYDYGLVQSLISEQTLLNVSGHAEYELTDNLNLTGTFIYGNRESQYDLAANPFGANQPTGPYTSGIVIPGTSASNPFGTDVSLGWRPQNYGGRENVAEGDQIFVDVGLDGRIDTFGGVYWSLAHTYSKTNSRVSTFNIPWATHLQRVLVPELCAEDPVCSTLPSGPVTNIDDLFSGDVPFTADQEAYAFYTSTATSSFESRSTQLNFSGSLFELPAGAVAYAIGAEYRQEEGVAYPDAVAASGESISNGTSFTQGSFNVGEVYGEIEVPLLADMPFAQELTLNVQGRYSDFSNFGETDTYKVGLNWAVTQDLRLRASYGTSFRAPNIGELAGGGIESFASIADPCTNFDAPGGNPQVAANCAALGAPAGFTQAAPQIRVRSGGNPFLGPEEGESFTVGAVLTPRWLPDLALTIDYYEIELTNAIIGGDLQTRLDQCYADPDFLTLINQPGDCFNLDERTSSFNLPVLNNGPQNDPTPGTGRGLDWVLRYNFADVLGGDIVVNWSNSHTFESYQFGEDIGFIFDSNGSISSPDWRSVLDLEYIRDNWSFQWTTDYSTEMTDYRVFLGFAGFANNALGYEGSPDYFLHSARLRYNWNDTNFVFGVNNVLDEDPPYVFATGNNLAPMLHDFVGRYYFMSVQKSF